MCYKSHGKMLWLLEVPGISQGPHPECLPRESAAYTLMSAVVTIVDLAGSGGQGPAQAVRDYLLSQPPGTPARGCLSLVN